MKKPILEFAEKDLNIKHLNYVQKDALMLLERQPDLWSHVFKPLSPDMVTVLDIYKKWEKSGLVAC